MSALPPLELLIGLQHQTFYIETGSGYVPCRLSEVRAGLGMSAQHQAYAAIFTLPQGVTASDGNYCFVDQQGGRWALFASRIDPDQAGCHQLEIVIHRTVSEKACPA